MKITTSSLFTVYGLWFTDTAEPGSVLLTVNCQLSAANRWVSPKHHASACNSLIILAWFRRSDGGPL